MKKYILILIAFLFATISCEKLPTTQEDVLSTGEWELMEIPQKGVELKGYGQFSAGGEDEFLQGSQSSYFDIVYGDADWTSTSYGSGGSLDLDVDWDDKARIDFDTENPQSTEYARVRVRLNSVSDPDRKIRIYVLNFTEDQGFVYSADILDASDLTSTSTWYNVSFPYYTRVQSLISSLSSWDSGDDYGIGLRIDGSDCYVDNFAFGKDSPLPTISGPGWVNVSQANLPSFTEDFSCSGGAAWAWSCTSATAVGYESYSTVEYDFDSYGGNTIRLKWKATGRSLWSAERTKSFTVYPVW